jgi:hypothetical protein
LGATSAIVQKTRSLPGHRRLRVEAFGPAVSAAARDALVAGVAEFARSEPRVLAVLLEVFATDSAQRESIGRVAQSLGFRPNDDYRRYVDTLAVDLAPDTDSMFANLHARARRGVREAGKKGFRVEPITDPRFAPQMAMLLQETMARTGGNYTQHDWPSIIAFSSAHPSLSRIVGNFRPGDDSIDSLVAFAWGSCHGDRVEYGTAASTRREGTVSLSYPLAWDLITWAKTNGAAWFDFGGVTSGTQQSDDPLGGISDFKRYFTKNVLRVGEEWILEPRPVLAGLARKAAKLAARGFRLAGRPAQVLSFRHAPNGP